MERADKIFTALMAAGLIAILACQAKRKNPERMNVSAAPKLIDAGPAVYLSALPARRHSEDFAPPVSYSEALAF